MPETTHATGRTEAEILRLTGLGLLSYGAMLGAFLAIVNSPLLHLLDAVLFGLAGFGLWWMRSRALAVAAVALTATVTYLTVVSALTVSTVHATNVMVALVLFAWSSRGLVGSLRACGEPPRVPGLFS